MARNRLRGHLGSDIPECDSDVTRDDLAVNPWELAARTRKAIRLAFAAICLSNNGRATFTRDEVLAAAIVDEASNATWAIALELVTEYARIDILCRLRSALDRA